MFAEQVGWMICRVQWFSAYPQDFLAAHRSSAALLNIKSLSPLICVLLQAWALNIELDQRTTAVRCANSELRRETVEEDIGRTYGV